MAIVRDIRNRISGVRKTQKITRAMKMVSAAKFARAQSAIRAARPYAEKMAAVLASVSSGVVADVHPLLTPREKVRQLDVVLVTSDRGLCGAYNANLIKHAERFIVERRPGLESVSIVAVGRKRADYFRRRPTYGEIQRRWTGLKAPTPESAAEIAGFLMERYENGEADEVVLIYSEFQSALTQKPGDERLLPVAPGEAGLQLVHEIEPSPERLLALLVPRAVEFAVFRALLENQAGEHGARMTAMDSATNNTEDLIRTLTLDLNKARQAAITSELIEIVSGAEAL